MRIPDDCHKSPHGGRLGWRVAPLLVLTTVFLAGSLVAQPPQLIPQPREMQTKAEAFQVTPKTEIVLATPVAREDRFAAQSLEVELETVTGRHYLAVSSRSSGQAAIVLGRFEQPSVERMLKRRGISTEGIGKQGYVLDIEPKEVLVAGKDAAGLFYGVQTLRQLIVRNGQQAEILGARVRDWPALAFRGTQVDMSRGPVPKLDYLKRIVRTISEFKMNQLYMYIEDSYRMDGQPLVGVLSDTLSRDDWKELVAYAAPYHVEIVPATEACGHLHKILRFEQYSGMGERPHGRVLAAQDAQAAQFLDQMYNQMVPVFSSPTYHIGCDETYELGRGRSADLVEQEGYGKVYVESVKRAYDAVRRYHKQVMFWGDIAVRHPEMIPSLPKDLIVASWEYGAHDSYDRWLKPFEGTGMKIFVCPWVGNTRVIIPDYEEAAFNIQGFIRDGKRAGAVGTDITVWNDDGETLYGANWWSIVYGAASAWEASATDVKDFDSKFDWAFYRNTDHRFVQAIKQLGHINEIVRAGGEVTTYDEHFGGTGNYLFWQDPFSAQGRQMVEKAQPVASLVRKQAEEAYTVLTESASRARRNADTLKNLQFAALKLDALAMRYQYAQEISDFYADAVAQQNGGDRRALYSDLSDISSTNGRLQDLRDYNTRLAELYRELWLSENLPGWLPNILQLYRRNGQMWQEKIARFGEIRAHLRQGKPLPPAESLGLLPSSSGGK